MALAKIPVLLASCNEILFDISSLLWLSDFHTQERGKRGKRGRKEAEEAEIWGGSSSHSGEGKKKKKKAWKQLCKFRKYPSQTRVKYISTEIVWNTSEKEYRLWRSQRQCFINLGLLLFIQSSLCADQNCSILSFEPHKSCLRLAYENLSYKGGGINDILLEKGKR